MHSFKKLSQVMISEAATCILGIIQNLVYPNEYFQCFLTSNSTSLTYVSRQALVMIALYMYIALYSYMYICSIRCKGRD